VKKEIEIDNLKAFRDWKSW